jgi:hypothetical protein
MSNRDKLLEYILEHLLQYREDFCYRESMSIAQDADSSVYYYMFCKMFFDVQRYYSETMIIPNGKRIYDDFEAKFEITGVRISGILRHIYLRGIWHDFLEQKSVRATFVLNFDELKKISVSIRADVGGVTPLLHYQDGKLGYLGLFDCTEQSTRSEERKEVFC